MRPTSLAAFVGLVLSAIAVVFGSVPAAAIDRCIAVAQAPGHNVVVPVRLQSAQLKATEARITYVGHSTFLIESPKGVRIATDYNDYVRPSAVPEIATMNRAHSSHYTNVPDATIRHVLRGWNPTGGAAQHDVTLEDVRARNVPTNIRDWQGGADVFGNSIFVFELAGLCIAHLGHLHHTLTDKQLAQIGQMDIVLAPVDGSYTLDHAGMREVLRALKAPLIIPMHYFSEFTLGRFLDAVRGDFDIRTLDVPTIVVSRATLPTKPQVLILPGN